MKILTTLTFSTLFLFSPVGATKTEAQCLLCGAVGFAIGSIPNEQTPVDDGNVIYVAPRISERIANPLAVRFASSAMMNFSNEQGDRGGMKNSSLEEIFAATVADYQKYTLLEVKRIINPQNYGKAQFLFVYIEKDKISPLK